MSLQDLEIVAKKYIFYSEDVSISAKGSKVNLILHESYRENFLKKFRKDSDFEPFGWRLFFRGDIDPVIDSFSLIAEIADFNTSPKLEEALKQTLIDSLKESILRIKRLELLKTQAEEFLKSSYKKKMELQYQNEINENLKILGLPEDGKIPSSSNLDQKYQLLAIKYHPDKNLYGSEMMKKINVARDYLLNFDDDIFKNLIGSSRWKVGVDELVKALQAKESAVEKLKSLFKE